MLETKTSTHWDQERSKFVQITDAELMKHCRETGQSLLITKEIYDRDQKELNAEATKNKFHTQKMTNYVQFHQSGLYAEIVRDGMNFVRNIGE